jgi:hypothetical protein
VTIRDDLALVLSFYPNMKTFKIGRCQAKDFDGLKKRPMYDGCNDIAKLWRGSGKAIEQDEASAIKLARILYGSVCANDNVGGGPVGDDEEHVVYVVIDPP